MNDVSARGSAARLPPWSVRLLACLRLRLPLPLSRACAFGAIDPDVSFTSWMQEEEVAGRGGKN